MAHLPYAYINTAVMKVGPKCVGKLEVGVPVKVLINRGLQYEDSVFIYKLVLAFAISLSPAILELSTKEVATGMATLLTSLEEINRNK